jgi:mediator of RNA polymerase II transcription subunit 14
MSFSITEVKLPPGRARAGIGPPSRTPVERARARVQENAALALLGTQIPDGERKPSRVSDFVESLHLTSSWAPQERALGVPLARDALALPAGALAVDTDDLDLGQLLRTALRTHVHAILSAFGARLAETNAAFARPGAVAVVEERGHPVLRVRMCADEAVLVALDARTGRFALRDTGDLAGAARGPRLAVLADRVNESPVALLEVLVRLRLATITDLAEQAARYLGLQTFRVRNWAPDELRKLGPTLRGALYVRLARAPRHYLVLVIADERLRFALLSVRALPGPVEKLVMEDIGWLDVERICGDASVRRAGKEHVGTAEEDADFTLDTQVLRAIYAYCWYGLHPKTSTHCG